MKYNYVLVTWSYRSWMRDVEQVSRFFVELTEKMDLDRALPFAMADGVGLQHSRGHAIIRGLDGLTVMFEFLTTRRLDSARLIHLLKQRAPVIGQTRIKVEHPLIAVTKNKGEKQNGKKEER